MIELLQNFALAAETIEVGDYIVDLGITTWWLPYVYNTIKYFLIFLTAIYIIGIILILIRVEGGFKIRIKEAIEEAMEAGRLPKTKIQRKWDAILADIESNNLEKQKSAVISAENMLDISLKYANYSGENLESRLKKIPEDQLNFKEDIIWAHKLKKKIESDRSEEVDSEEARRAVNIFQRTLKELNVL